MELSRLLCGARAWAISPDIAPDAPIGGISTDSRTVTPGDAFIAIDGSRQSGEAFVTEAIARGARLVVCERRADGAPYAAVEDARRAAAVMWSNLLGSPGDGLDVICVTGTCGKSSVSTLLCHILCELGVKCGLIGTLGAYCGKEPLSLGGESETSDIPSAMTTPDPKYLYGALAQMRRLGCRAAVIEASSHAIAQKKLAALSPRLSIFTNLSPEHLDFHKDMDGYLRAKAALFAESGEALVCGDDPAAALIATYVPSGRVAYVARGRGEFAYGGETARGLEGVSYTFRLASSGGLPLRINVPVAGEFTVVNSALAASAAIRLGAEPEAVAAALATASPIAGRMEVLHSGDFTVIRDFAHTPEAMRRALGFARSQTAGRLVCVFGCGGDRDKTKRAPMGAIAAALCDLAIVTSDNPRTEDPAAIIGDILAGCESAPNVRAVVDRREAIEEAISALGGGDLLILLGKGHETWQIDAAGKRPFDEAAIVREILGGK